MRQIFLIILGISTLLFADFSKSGNIVTDSITRLEWQDNTPSSPMVWEEAILYCENLVLDKYNDWRLPNIRELTSLVDEKRFDPSISPIFKNISSISYWTSTSAATQYNFAWRVYFRSGYLYTVRKSTSFGGNVRCVRAGLK